MNSVTSDDLSALGSPDNPLRVAIVGSGPSGFYAAEALLKSGLTVQIDMIERLPVPFGLVRFGVAPDHPKLKQCTAIFDQVAQSSHFRFIGNVMVGRDISVAQLQHTHHAVLFACGAEVDRRLGLENECLPGSHTATEFVGWYNGHPDYRERQFDLSGETAVIIGHGNVAIDVARILCKPVDELRSTDIAGHALEVLAASRVREVHLIGRRGPAQASFTAKELRELGELNGCEVQVSTTDLQLGPVCLEELKVNNNFNAAKNMETFRGWSTRAVKPAAKRILFHFFQSPIAMTGTNRLDSIRLEKNTLTGLPFEQSPRGTGITSELACNLVFRSIGYRGVPIPGVPFDTERGIFSNTAGRIGTSPGLYAAGWIKRGPSGIIGTNRADAVATVQTLLGDLLQFPARPRSDADTLWAFLAHHQPVVGYADWQRIDAEERLRGAAAGKPREKITRVSDMLDLVERSRHSMQPMNIAQSLRSSS